MKNILLFLGKCYINHDRVFDQKDKIAHILQITNINPSIGLHCLYDEGCKSVTSQATHDDAPKPYISRPSQVMMTLNVYYPYFEFMVRVVTKI